MGMLSRVFGNCFPCIGGTETKDVTMFIHVPEEKLEQYNKHQPSGMDMSHKEFKKLRRQFGYYLDAPVGFWDGTDVRFFVNLQNKFGRLVRTEIFVSLGKRDMSESSESCGSSSRSALSRGSTPSFSVSSAIVSSVSEFSLIKETVVSSRSKASSGSLDRIIDEIMGSPDVGSTVTVAGDIGPIIRTTPDLNQNTLEQGHGRTVTEGTANVISQPCVIPPARDARVMGGVNRWSRHLANDAKANDPAGIQSPSKMTLNSRDIEQRPVAAKGRRTVCTDDFYYRGAPQRTTIQRD